MFGMSNLMPTNFCRFWCNGMNWVMQSPAEQDRLVERGLVGKLRQVEGGAMSGKAHALAMLEPAFKRHSEREARRAAGEVQEAADTARIFRQQGNEAFKAGQYEEAARAYGQGVGFAPQDPLLHANRSLALLKLEKYAESLEAARDATQLDPGRPKYWARMGDAHRALGQHALALLCYETAARLAPKDEEIQQRKDAAEAEVEPGQRIDPAKVPHKNDIYKDDAWVMRMARMDPQTMQERLDEEVNRQTCKLLGLPPDSTQDWKDTPKGYVMGNIKPLLELQQSAATAASVPQRHAHWCVSWSDMPFMEGQKAPMFMISVMDNYVQRATMMRAGRPTALVVVQALKLGMTHPEEAKAKPERPLHLLVAHRMKSEYAAIEKEMRQLGVICILESKEEAAATAAAHGTNPDGFNFAEDEAIYNGELD